MVWLDPKGTSSSSKRVHGVGHVRRLGQEADPVGTTCLPEVSSAAVLKCP